MTDLPDVQTPALDVTQLFREHAAMVERALRRSGVRESDVADATQEVFVVAHRKLHEFEGRASVSTWLYRIALRVAAAERRRARHRREVLGGGASQGEASAGSEASGDLAQDLAHAELLRDLSDALATLDEPQRRALALHDLEGLHMREVARRERIKLKTAFSRMYAARRALAAELRRLGYCAPAWLPWTPLPRGTSWLERLTTRGYVDAQLSAAASSYALGSGSWQSVGLALGAAWCVVVASADPSVSVVAPNVMVAVATASARSPMALTPALVPPPAAAPARKHARRQRQPQRAVQADGASSVALEETIVRMGGEALQPSIEHPLASHVRGEWEPARVATLSPAMPLKVAPHASEAELFAEVPE
jgi:RNA polymerase sigma-70 factor (ECF subfamily)